ncbi:choice-of-anchor Q domain-containing protein [Spirosoma fluminis]
MTHSLPSFTRYLVRALNLLVLLLSVSLLAQAQTIRYVRTDGANANPATATTWATSTTNLQGAIDASAAGDQVWVAAGTYKPTSTADRTISFSMKEGVAIYGGFVGNETERSARPAVNPITGNPNSTTLSGDIGTANSNSDNSYHVIYNLTILTTTAILDGFVITGGKADGSGTGQNSGGGMYNNGFGTGNNCSPLIQNCFFLSNSATESGAALFNDGSFGGRSNPVITNCSFENNSASSGGAIFNKGDSNGSNTGADSSPVLTNCSFLSNSATAGGAMVNTGQSGGHSSPTLTNCSFQNNRATNVGGAMVNNGIYSGTSNPILTNCSFQGNSATRGGAMYNDAYGDGTSSPTLTNCSFQNNSASSGGAMYSKAIVGTAISIPMLTNCVVFGNGGGNTFARESSSPVVATYSLFENTVGDYSGSNNLTTDVSPFVSATDARLNGCSPAIDAGNNAVNSSATDLAGNPRRYNGGIIDMGAYEYQANPTAITLSAPGMSTASISVAFSQSFVASGGSSPYSYSQASGSLPTSLSLTTTGELLGTPTQTGSFTFTAKVSDATGCSAVSEAYVLTVNDPTPTQTASTIRYVKAGATGNGTSWSNASGDLQAMINASASGDQVWMAGGTYKPSTSGLTDARAASFSLKGGVNILGGFTGAAGSEGNAGARTASPSSTTLSGDLGTPGEQADNAYHVVLGSLNAGEVALLDGLCVTAGNANGSTGTDKRGGGMFISGNVSLANCLVTGNTCIDLGGGIYMQSATSGSWDNCQITNNSAPQGNGSGGGGVLLSCSNYQLRNCQFTANQTSFLGGGLYISASTLIQLVSCVFDQNAATAFGGFGGGLHITSSSNATIVNSFFTRNRGNYGGALLTGNGSVATCINTTIRANTSGVAGGAVYSFNDGRINLTNCVLWDNGGQNAAAGFNNYFSYTLTPPVPFNYHDQGGNIIATFDPFESSTGPALKACAPAIDAGSDADNATTTDVLGNARKVRTIDMGAAEFRGTPYTLSVTAQATPSAVCVGSSTSLQATPSGSPNAPYSYIWVAPGGATLSSTSGNPVTATLTNAGTPNFSVNVTDRLGCLATASVSVTANALPTQYNVTGGGSYCAGGSGVVVGLSGSQTDVSYQLRRDDNAVGSPVAGTGSALSFGSQTAAGVYTVQATNASTTCQQAMSGSASVTVNILPTPGLTNSGPLSFTNTGVTLTATAGQGYSYSFSQGATQLSQPNTARVTTTGIYSVTITTTEGCSATASTTVRGGNNPTICRGGTAVINVAVEGDPVKYEWYKNSLTTPKIMETPQLFRGTATSSLTIINAQTNTQGDFYLKVTDRSGTITLYGPYRLTVDASCRAREIAGLEVPLRVELAPNPIQQDRLRAIVGGAQGHALSVELVDLSGKPIHQQHWKQADTQQLIDWDMQAQASGLYILQVVSEAGKGLPAQHQSVRVIKP